MRRETIAPRADWQAQVEALGLIWHTANGAPYWTEGAYYAFTSAEIARLEAATAELYRMFVSAGEYVVENNLFHLFDIPEPFWPMIAEAWRAEPPALNYGRFDLGFDGNGEPKLFEFNCDTPTSLLEAAVIQWDWMKAHDPGGWDQWNSLHEKIVAKWRDIGPYLASSVVHLAHTDDAAGEDSVTTAYLADTAREGGLDPKPILMRDIGWDGHAFRDIEGAEMTTIYKLYPWEWMVREDFGRHLPESAATWVEPIWKMIWSNKAILPILWDLFPRHPNLLWAATEAPRGADYVRKPILAREGANIEIVRDGAVRASTNGAYSESRAIYQGLYDLPAFDGAFPVIGSWVVDGEPAGMGIREDGLITGNLARFVPHVIAA